MALRVLSAAWLLLIWGWSSGSAAAQWAALPRSSASVRVDGAAAFPPPDESSALIISPMGVVVVDSAHIEGAEVSTGPAGVLRLAAGGIVGGALGAGAGWLLASATGDETLGPIGLLAGEAIGVPVGVHVANGRRGRFGTVLLSSLGGFAAAAVLATAFEDYLNSEAGFAVIAPVLQLGITIVAERRTSR